MVGEMILDHLGEPSVLTGVLTGRQEGKSGM